jgi:hypothetical protein
MHDGRLRAAYSPQPLIVASDVVATDRTSDVGNMAWVGQSLVRLYAKTSNAADLQGAEAIATWVRQHAYDTRGRGGYTGGYLANGTKIRWKSTEHNIDLYALFSLLAAETGQSAWSADAVWAQSSSRAPRRSRQRLQPRLFLQRRPQRRLVRRDGPSCRRACLAQRAG